MQVAVSLYALAVMALWEWLRSLPVVAQVAVWILILPLAVGLWAWESELGQGPRIAVGVGLVAWTILAFSQLIQGIRGPA
jgi:hypothetical protein